ncbi:T9SS type B sorting domain-containing protein [Flavobacterium ginsenosidimutans]|uniref:T9SS type B sorting domain-containing protein n=1 Tax=Flavobacterium ginsenosidimutans TaxID=687844 RepID=UPI000DAEB1C4|nr:T9SS type B sorting domain-containing protein [Flavobacterium ginsenosidimutans]KAF2335428.1 T9SS type B sorting domain-containing protein [Flavobacterium ginsenosidimutans]
MNFKQHNFYLLLLFFYSSTSFSQQEASVWYFGKNAGLKFHNDGSVTSLNDGKLVTNEGCASIADSSGNLLFYTDGRTVWDKNHIIMPNGDYWAGTGLLGDPSSTNSAIIVPKPGNSKIYYIFTLDEPHHENATVYPAAFSGNYFDEDSGKTPDNDDGLNNGLNYSIVDLSKIGNNGSIGDIVSRNNPLITYDTNPNGEEIKYKCSEKITSVREASGNGFWVITQFTDYFYSFRVTSSGIASNPVKSAVLPSVPTFGYRRNAIGCFKASPDGKKLAAAYDQIDTPTTPYDNYKGSVYIYDFDNLSGKVSNPKLVVKDVRAYGVEFSNNSNVLYASFDTYETSQSMGQFDLLSNDIQSSKVLLFHAPYGIGALQLAPNGKIYYSSYFPSSLGVINNPNVVGLGCNFDPIGQPLIGETTHNKGLPPFITSFFDAFFDVKNLCLGDNTSFSLNSSQDINAAVWDFGDGTTSTDLNPSHTYLSAGTFTVSVTAINSSGSGTKTKDITISMIPVAMQAANILVCDDNNDGIAVFDLTAQNATVLNGQDPALYNVTYFKGSTEIISPKLYSNTSPYQAEKITAEVSNKNNNDCKSSTTFDINVFDSPKPNLPANIPDLISCDNTTVGSDTDGKIIFDLTQREAGILNGQSPSQFVISYYKDAEFTQAIVLPTSYSNATATETIFVKVTNKDNASCMATTSFNLKVFALPIIVNSVDLKQCDDDIDGFSAFNLEEAKAKITSNSANETITFYKTLADAKNNSNTILNPKTYRNQTISTDKVYVRVENANNCYRIAQLNLIVSSTQIPSTYSKVFIQCDDAVLGTNKDGIAAFNFSSATNEIKAIFPSGQLLDIGYYQNVEDALAEKNAISDISNYRNTGSPDSQKIFIRVDSRLNNDCLGLGGYITLRVEPVPVTQNLKKIHCDDDQDGLYAFDTSTIEQELLNGLTNVTVSYLDQNNTPLSSPLPNPFITGSQIVKAILTSNTTTACLFNSTITFIVDDLPEVFEIDPSLTTVCDDESDPLKQDGKYAFDTSSFEATILGGQTAMTVKYYDANNNLLSSPLPNPFVTNSQNVKVEVINPNNTSCSATTFVNFIVNPVPKINLKGEGLVCSNLTTFTKQIDAGLLDLSLVNDYGYTWFFNGFLISDQTNYSLTVNKEGIFTVQVTDKQTNCSRTRTIKVSASDIASNIIAVVGQSNTISVSATGNGDYVYALDDQNGDYQTGNTFENVHAGIHTVYIKDLNGCGTVPKEVPVFGIPNFFTPNHDSYNDYWNIEGVDPVSNSKTTIEIFDRYGKLLKQITPMSQGWDGTYLGSQMPADDYWYVIKLEDNRIFKGHFALKR